MAKILKFISFQQLLKHFKSIFKFGGQIQCLWVMTLWFSALQLPKVWLRSYGDK